MQEYFEPEQAFSISMPQFGFKISIAYKKACMWSPPLYLLIINTVDERELRCLIITQHSFCQLPRLFQRPCLSTLEISANLHVHCTLPVYSVFSSYLKLESITFNIKICRIQISLPEHHFLPCESENRLKFVLKRLQWVPSTSTLILTKNVCESLPN